MSEKASVSVKGGAYVQLKIGGVTLSFEELIFFSLEKSTSLDRPPVLEFQIKTTRQELIDAIERQRNNVYLEWGQNSTGGSAEFIFKATFKISKSQRQRSTENALKIYNAKADFSAENIWKKGGVLGTSVSTLATHLTSLDCFKKGPDNLKLNILDDIASRAQDIQRWTKPETPLILYLNDVIPKGAVIDNPENKLDWSYIGSYDFENDGSPCFNLMDLKLRTKYLGLAQYKIGKRVVKGFTWKNSNSMLAYSSEVVHEDKSSSEMSSFWKKKIVLEGQLDYVSYIDPEEPLLFTDSTKISENEKNAVFEGEGYFKAIATSNNHKYRTTPANKIFYRINHGFLKRISKKISIERVAVPAKLADVVQAEFFSNGERGSLKDDKSITGLYMITRIFWTYSDGYISTHIQLNRDSYCKEN